MNFTFNLLVIAISVALTVGAEPPALSRPQVNLDGEWNFATDPDNRGETEKWYLPDAKLPAMPAPGYAPGANGKICVPGIWDNQGYGKATDKFHHHFEGKGWYQREIAIPREWKRRRVFLVITGVCRYSKTWINGQFLGEHVGYVSVQEHDITRHVAAGETATLTIQVDSKQRWEIDALAGASSLIDYVDTPWGGIWGHVRLEARADGWLSDPFVQPDVEASRCSVSATVSGEAGSADQLQLEVFGQDGQRAANVVQSWDGSLPGGQTVSIAATLPNPKLWTPDHPSLYSVRLSLLKAGKPLDCVESRFGMRQFSTDGYRLLLNGKPIFLRGYGDDHIYPAQMAMPCDKELHLARLRTIKSYGFNHVRHHSTMMPPEYYDACDEVGMISTAEFPIADPKQIPGVGSKWKAKVSSNDNPQVAVETYKREWAGAIKRYRNHPSIMAWVMGNELYLGPDGPVADFAGIAGQLDPQRMFIESDGWRRSILDPKNDRGTMALYLLGFREDLDPMNDPGKHKTPKPIKPVLDHEMGNYVTFSRPDLSGQFQHNFKPFWLNAGKKKLEKLGLWSEADQWAEKSERLYLLLHKYNTESLRKNPFLSGYHWWLFQDYWITSNGLADHYFRPKAIGKDEVLRFNNDVVLLQDGLQFTYRGKDRLKLKLLLSNFHPTPLQGNFNYSIKAGGKTVVARETAMVSVAQGGVTEMMKLDITLPETKSPVELEITAEADAAGRRWNNVWTSWLYPSVIRPDKLAAPVFSDDTRMKLPQEWDLLPIPTEGDLPERAVYVASHGLDKRLVAALERGASVVLLGGADSFLKARHMTFRTSWWKAGWKNAGYDDSRCGTFVYPHSTTRIVAPDSWCDEGWFHLVEGAQKYVLEPAPARPNVIIRALPSILLVEDDALLFEVAVGKGTLTVSGLNHPKAQGRPENEWLIARLLEHAAGFPQPKTRWPASFLLPAKAARGDNGSE
jgi:hypothetical protein